MTNPKQPHTEDNMDKKTIILRASSIFFMLLIAAYIAIDLQNDAPRRLLVEWGVSFGLVFSILIQSFRKKS